MRIRPVSNHVIVELIKENEMIGALYIPDQYAPKAEQAKVIAIGPGYYGPNGYEPMEVKVGDIVLFQKHAGQNFTLAKDVITTVLEDKDICGIVEE